MMQAGNWPAPRVAWRAVVLLNAAYLLAFADRIVLSLLIVPIQGTFHLTDTQIGLLSGVAFGLCYTMFGLPAGYLADRVNRRTLIVAGVVLWSATTAACGLATGFAMLFVLRVGVGIGEAALHPAATSLIADFFAPERRARAYATYMMAGAAGTFFAFLLGGRLLQYLESVGPTTWPLVGTLLPWQAAFVTVASFGLPLVAALLALVPEPARQVEPRAGAAGAEPSRIADLLAFVRGNARLWAGLMLGLPLLLVGSYSLVSWLPVVFARVHGWAPGATAVRFALSAGLVSIAGTLLLGRVVEALRRRGTPHASLLVGLVGGATTNLCFAAAMLVRDPWAALALLALGAPFLLAPGVAALTCIAEVTPNRLRAQASALVTLMTGLITNTAGPFLVGVVSDKVLGDPARVNVALALVIAVCGTLGALLVWRSLVPLRALVTQRDAININ